MWGDGVSLLVKGASILEGRFSILAIGGEVYAERDKLFGKREWVVDSDVTLLNEAKPRVGSDDSVRKLSALFF